MQLYVFNIDLELIGIVDEIAEMEWVRKYYEGGECMVKALVTPNNINLLRKGNLICKKNDLSDVMFIMHRELSDSDDDGMELLSIEGISLSSRILSSRVTTERQILKGTAKEIIENLVLSQTNNHSNINRHINNFVVDTSPNIDFTATYEHNSLYKQLDEECTSIAIMDGCGYRIKLDINKKELVFEVYRGKDLSDKVMFAETFDNLTDQILIESDSNYKTTAIIAGQGENEDRDLVVYNDYYSGLDRLEVFIDARDIEQDKQIVQVPQPDGSMEDVEEPIKNGANAVKLLEERAKEKLSEMVEINSYTASITGTNYKYREDYDIGDMVSIKNDKWGIRYKERIIEIIEKYDGDGVDISIEFGQELPSLAKKIKQELRRI